MNIMENDRVREAVRANYGQVAINGASGCCEPAGSKTGRKSSCCGTEPDALEHLSKMLGYTDEELSSTPEGANLGLGCGNPNAIAGLHKGETVLDLGSGAGFDCFLASKQVGETGHVIGVDMTPEMVSRARANAQKGKYENVEFRIGEIEHLPVADQSVDVIISNCVINLSPDKLQVFREAFRVLKPGGRLAISDIVACIPLPKELREDMYLVSGCVGGAATMEELTAMIREAGFDDVRILPKAESKKFINGWVEGMNIDDLVISATIEAVRPLGRIEK
jgi:arsenite methyltransferase